MSAREDAINEEALTLWRLLRDEPPPDNVTGVRLLAALIERIPAPHYDRLQSLHLRASQLHRPKSTTA